MNEGNLIILRSVHGKQQGALTLNPVLDMSTGRLRGVKVLSPEEMRVAKKVVDGTTSRRITDNMTIDLSNEVDFIDWSWIKENKEIAVDAKSSLSNPHALYYVYKPDTELDERLNSRKNKAKAISLVLSYTDSELKDLSEYLGYNTESMRDKDILDILLGVAESKPNRIISAKDDSQFKTKIFLYKLVSKGIVRHDQNGTYRYGDIVVGLNNDSAIDWLNDKKNRSIVGKFYTQVFGSADESMDSVVEEFESLKGDKDKAGELGGTGEDPNVDPGKKEGNE